MNFLTDEEIFKCLSASLGTLAYAREIEAAVLSKLAEQDVEPIHQWRKVAGDGRWRDAPKIEAFERVDAYYEARTLYTETQLLAAQQRTAEACAKVAANGVGTGAYNDCCPNTDWDDGQDAIASAIRNGDWREYL